MRRWWLNGVSLWSAIAMAPEDGGGSGGAGEGGAPAEGTGAPESVLFPGEGKKGDAPADGTKPGDSAKSGDGKAEDKVGAEAWKPYVDDPAKSKDENDKARAENEIKNPDNPVNKVPDDGKYEFAMPEGMQLDEKLAAAVSPVMKEIGLTRGQAQKLAAVLADQRKAEAEAGAREWTGIQSKWVETARKDGEIGGAKWDASVEVAQRALAKFGTPELRDFLLTSGGGNHPEVIRFMTRVGNAISDDKPAHGDGGSGQPAEAAYVLFPNDKPKG